MLGFERKRSFDNSLMTGLASHKGLLTSEEINDLRVQQTAWNFYEGFHWEDAPAQDGPELTINYCRAFVDKLVAFELGKSFAIKVHPNVNHITTIKRDKETGVDEPEEIPIIVTEDGRTLFQFLEDVWEDNEQYSFCVEMGQMKSITGRAWVQVRFFGPDDDELVDIFDEYPKGRIGILLHGSNTIFPTYDPHRKGVLTSLTILYEYKDTNKDWIGRQSVVKRVFRQTWTAETIETDRGDGSEREVVENTLGFIPFVQIKNLNIAGRNESRGDLDDVIPLNMELDAKSSNVSEIIDYHAAPVTVVYGAKIGNLEKGANKTWGGLPKDARVENLSMQTDLTASTVYISQLKTSMCEVIGIPESVLGGAAAISNTSGVALQYMNLPLIEKTRIKKMNTETALEMINKFIIHIAFKEGLISIPEGVEPRDFYWTEVTLPDTLPKDMLLEIQQVQAEMKTGMESRKGGMHRLGKENIEILLEEIDADIAKNPSLYGIIPQLNMPKINSGMTNGQTPVEQVRTEITGQNGGAPE